MIEIRKSIERGGSEPGWRSSRHRIWFGSRMGPMGVESGAFQMFDHEGLPPDRSPRRNGRQEMEIVSYVLDDISTHLENSTTMLTDPRDLPHRSTGIDPVQGARTLHSNGMLHFLQVWVDADPGQTEPHSRARYFSCISKRGCLCLIASGDATKSALLLRGDICVYASALGAGDELTHCLAHGRMAYLHVARGHLSINGRVIGAGETMKLEDEAWIVLSGLGLVEFLLFELPAGNE